jgi:hypothetical protein
MPVKNHNLSNLNAELENHDRLLSQVKDLLKDIEKTEAATFVEKMKVCEKGIAPTNQPTFFPVAFRNEEARALADQVFSKAMELIKVELTEKFILKYNEKIEQLNRNGDKRFSRIE